MSDFYRTKSIDWVTGCLSDIYHLTCKVGGYAGTQSWDFLSGNTGNIPGAIITVGGAGLAIWYTVDHKFNVKNMFMGVAKPVLGAAGVAAGGLALAVLIDGGRNVAHEVNTGTDGDVIEMKVPAQFRPAP